MRRNKVSQLPLRRAYFLMQPFYMRSLVLAVMYFEDSYKQAQMAKYLRVSVGTVNHYLQELDHFDWTDEDLAQAREIVANMRGPMMITHW